MKQIMLWIIRFYRKFISPYIPPRCRFYPTCSTYALTAYEKHGFFKGTVLTVWRILRCNPFGKGGVDYVPEKFCLDYFRNGNTCNDNGKEENPSQEDGSDKSK